MGTTTFVEMRKDVRRQLTWTVVLGVITALVGVAAIVEPYIAAIAAAIYFGALLLVRGIIGMALAIETRHAGWVALRILAAVIIIALGFTMLMMPLAGALSLSLFLGAAFIASGIIGIVHGFQLRPVHGWGWTVANGLVSFVAGLLIAANWPGDSLLVLGLLVGVTLLFDGIWMAAIAGSLRANVPAPPTLPSPPLA